MSEVFVNELIGRTVFPVNRQVPPVQPAASCASHSEAFQPHPHIQKEFRCLAQASELNQVPKV